MNSDNLTVLINDTKHGSEHSISDYIAATETPLVASMAVLFNAVTSFVMCTFCGKIRSHYVLIAVQCSADLIAAFSYILYCKRYFM